MQLRNAVHRLRGQLVREAGIFIFEFVNGPVRGLLQPPRPAQVNHMHAAMDRLGNPLARDLVRCGQEEHVHALGLQSFPVERLQRISAIAADMWIKLIELASASGLSVAGKQHRLVGIRMPGEDPRQFKPGVTGCSNNRGLDFRGHQARISSRRVCSFFAVLLSGVMIRTVSSPATVPTTSSQPSPSIASATGWALPDVVLMTSRFCARRASRTNSRTIRETVGAGSVGASPLRSVYPSAVRTRPNSWMSRERVACVTGKPRRASTLHSSCWLGR